MRHAHTLTTRGGQVLATERRIDRMTEQGIQAAQSVLRAAETVVADAELDADNARHRAAAWYDRAQSQLLNAIERRNHARSLLNKDALPH